MDRLYLVPIIAPLDAGGAPQRGPKYFGWDYNPTGIGVAWSGMDYGFMPSMLVLAKNIGAADDATLSAAVDVYAFPLNLDQAIPGNNPLSTFFETINVPTNWLTPSNTYRDFLRQLAGMFQFMQRYSGIAGAALLIGGTTLNTRFNQLTSAQQAWFRQTVQSFGFNDAIINPNNTMRQLLRVAGDYWSGLSFYLGGFEF
jgi:hypothetical protein